MNARAQLSKADYSSDYLSFSQILFSECCYSFVMSSLETTVNKIQK